MHHQFEQILTSTGSDRVILAVPWAPLPESGPMPHLAAQRALAQALAAQASAALSASRLVPVVLTCTEARAVASGTAGFAALIAGKSGSRRLTPLVREHLRHGRLLPIIEGVIDVDASRDMLEASEVDDLLRMLDREQVRRVLLVGRGSTGLESPAVARWDRLARHGFAARWLTEPDEPAHPLAAHLRAVLTNRDQPGIQRLVRREPRLREAPEPELLADVTAYLAASAPLDADPPRVPFQIETGGQELGEQECWNALLAAPSGLLLVEGDGATGGWGATTFLLSMAARAWRGRRPALYLNLAALHAWSLGEGSLAARLSRVAAGPHASDPAFEAHVDALPLLLLLDDTDRAPAAAATAFARLRDQLAAALRGEDALVSAVVATDRLDRAPRSAEDINALSPADQLATAVGPQAPVARMLPIAPSTREALLRRTQPACVELLLRHAQDTDLATPRMLIALADLPPDVLAGHLGMTADSPQDSEIDIPSLIIAAELQRTLGSSGGAQHVPRFGLWPAAGDVVLRLLEALALEQERSAGPLDRASVEQLIRQELLCASEEARERDIDRYVASFGAGQADLRPFAANVVHAERQRQMEQDAPTFASSLERAFPYLWRDASGSYRIVDRGLLDALGSKRLKRLHDERPDEAQAMLYALEGSSMVRRHRSAGLEPGGARRPHPDALRFYHPDLLARWLAFMLDTQDRVDQPLLRETADWLAFSRPETFMTMMQSRMESLTSAGRESIVPAIWWTALQAGAKSCLTNDSTRSWLLGFLNQQLQSEDRISVDAALSCVQHIAVDLVSLDADWLQANIDRVLSRESPTSTRQLIFSVTTSAAQHLVAGGKIDWLQHCIERGLADSSMLVRRAALTTLTSMTVAIDVRDGWFRAHVERVITAGAPQEVRDVAHILAMRVPDALRVDSVWFWSRLSDLLDVSDTATVEDTLMMIADLLSTDPVEVPAAIAAQVTRIVREPHCERYVREAGQLVLEMISKRSQMA